MIKNGLLSLLLLLTLQLSAQTRVLVFSKTAAFRHGSIKVGKPALIELGKANGFSVRCIKD